MNILSNLGEFNVYHNKVFYSGWLNRLFNVISVVHWKVNNYIANNMVK